MIGYVGNMSGKIFNEDEFTLIKRTLASGENIDEQNYTDKTVLITIVVGSVNVTLNNEEERNLEPGKVLKFDGDFPVKVHANDRSEYFVTLINKSK